MKTARCGGVGAAFLIILGLAAAHAQGTGSDVGGSALGQPINVPPPPSIAAVPAQPLTPPSPAMPAVVTPTTPPASTAPGTPPQFGPPGGAEPILEPEPAPQDPPPAPAVPAPEAGAGPAEIQPNQPALAPAAPPQNVWLPRQKAVLGVLDKEDGAVSRVAVQVGNSVIQGRLRIKILACLVRPLDAAPDAAVFLSVENIEENQEDVSASPQDAGSSQPIFTGWLLRAEPGASVVNDARDTFRLIGCDGAN